MYADTLSMIKDHLFFGVGIPNRIKILTQTGIGFPMM
jgi:hypothetical protein